MLMDNISLLVGRIAGLFAVAGLGWTLVRYRSLDAAATKGLAWIVVDVTLPCLIFIGIISFSVTSLPWLGLMGAGFAMSCLGLGLAWAWTKAKKTLNRGTFLFSVAVANSSFLPLPLASALWGESGVQHCLFYILGNNIFLLSIGLWLFSLDSDKTEKPLFSKVISHPQGWAAILALLWRLSGLKLPSWAFLSLSELGNATIPMAMLAVGGLMALNADKTLKNNGFIISGAVLKLLLMPALTLVGLKVLGIHGVLAGVLLLQASMPSLASAAAYASRFGGAPEWAGQASFWTSLASIVTIPAFLLLGASLGLF